uniref:ELL domain-containing protein n=1 Tax=Rhodnius prolixus TaxID=13249 RepID=T1HLD9_RHOPR
MAALVAGVQYGLTSQGHFNENKSLIFVKLTDSAFRAVEEYLKNRMWAHLSGGDEVYQTGVCSTGVGRREMSRGRLVK